MSQTRSIVAGGTAAVLLLGVGTSILFAEPPRASGGIGGPVVVTAAPVTDPPATGTTAPSTETATASAGPGPSASHEGALPASAADRAVTGTSGLAPGAPPAPAPAPVQLPPADRRPLDRHAVEPRGTDDRSDASPTAFAPADTATVTGRTWSTVAVGRSGTRLPWHGSIPTPRHAATCGAHR